MYRPLIPCSFSLLPAAFLPFLSLTSSPPVFHSSILFSFFLFFHSLPSLPPYFPFSLPSYPLRSLPPCSIPLFPSRFPLSLTPLFPSCPLHSPGPKGIIQRGSDEQCCALLRRVRGSVQDEEPRRRQTAQQVRERERESE